jgi:hypothetical protein
LSVEFRVFEKKEKFREKKSECFGGEEKK